MWTFIIGLAMGMALTFGMVLLYSLCVVAKRADEEAEAMAVKPKRDRVVFVRGDETTLN